jgi:hypothetical protein
LDATWEVEEFKMTYLKVQLTDTLFVGEEGNVVDLFVGRAYLRRKPVKETD